MDELLITVLQTYFSEEALTEIYRSFGIFGLFNHGDALEAMDPICNETDTYSSDYIQDRIMDKLHEHLNFLLEHHTLALIPEASLYEKNEILSGLYILQYLEDYEPIIRILEGTRSDEEMLAACLEEVTEFDETRTIELIASMRPSSLHMLRKFIYAKEELIQTAGAVTDEIKTALTVLAKIFPYGDFETAVLHSDLVIGVPFIHYLPIFHEELYNEEDLKTSAERILFMLCISSDGVKNPIQVFNEQIPPICPNPTKFSLLHQFFGALMGKYNEYKVASKQV